MGPVDYPGHVLLMTMADGQEVKPNHMNTFQACAYVKSVSFPVTEVLSIYYQAKSSHIIKCNGNEVVLYTPATENRKR